MKSNRLRTLSFSGGKVSIDDETSVPDQIANWQQITTEKQDALAEILNYLVPQMKAKRYVTYEQFEELQERLNKLEEEIKSKNSRLQNLSTVIEDASATLKRIGQNAYYICDDNHLRFFIILKEISKKYIDKLSIKEFELSRRFADLTIEIEPRVSSEDIPKGARKVW